MQRLHVAEQRRLLRETQAVMSLLEGFSDCVMDEVGRDLVPDVRAIRRASSSAARSGDDVRRTMLRLTGMDLKLEQYRRASASCAACTRPVGMPPPRLWDGPATLPPRRSSTTPLPGSGAFSRPDGSGGRAGSARLALDGRRRRDRR